MQMTSSTYEKFVKWLLSFRKKLSTLMDSYPIASSISIVSYGITNMGQSKLSHFLKCAIMLIMTSL